MPKRDPERAQRMARAALAVVSERGIEGLTHRAVAAEAGVPLGSTTYYFRTLDDLLEAALTVAMAHGIAEFDALSDEIQREGDIVGPVTRYIVRSTTVNSASMIIEFELYLAAIRRPKLQQISRSWGESMPNMLERHCPRDIAERISVTSDGLLIKALVQGAPPPERMVVEALRSAWVPDATPQGGGA